MLWQQTSAFIGIDDVIMSFFEVPELFQMKSPVKCEIYPTSQSSPKPLSSSFPIAMVLFFCTFCSLLCISPFFWQLCLAVFSECWHLKFPSHCTGSPAPLSCSSTESIPDCLQIQISDSFPHEHEDGSFVSVWTHSEHCLIPIHYWLYCNLN